MASSPLPSKSSFHARSASFPSQPHPLISQVDDHLCRLRTSEATSSSSLSSIAERLSVVEDMYDCVDDLILLPNTQQAFAQNRMRNGLRRWSTDIFISWICVLQLKMPPHKQSKMCKIFFHRYAEEGMEVSWEGKKVEPQDEEANSNEFEKVDAALRNLLIAHKTGRNENKIDLEKVQNQLQTIELGIQDLEAGLECLFRRFIKTRVSLLNIINH
ncbi:hypothetical protein Acr_09g0009590 [Actinidia rufa]|uniref:Uncharacterized protein n=1 Tax=Actinidia rufa TaxID=165716 RepID=A0A7J0F7D8_9ERIC|nr:hypothetical protein Acr_09g0009590 [Actinidia rufa]